MCAVTRRSSGRGGSVRKRRQGAEPGCSVLVSMLASRRSQRETAGCSRRSHWARCSGHSSQALSTHRAHPNTARAGLRRLGAASGVEAGGLGRVGPRAGRVWGVRTEPDHRPAQQPDPSQIPDHPTSQSEYSSSGPVLTGVVWFSPCRALDRI